MTERPWKPDARAVAEAEQALAAALESSDLRDDGSARALEGLVRVLRAAGQLVVLDAADAASSATRKLEARWRVGRDVVVALLDREEMCDALEDGAVRLRDALAKDVAANDPAFAEECAAALAVRDHAEIELLGAAFLLGCPPEALEASSSARLVFDEVVRPESFWLVAANERRQATLATLSPRVRARFWWWHEGAGIAASAIAAMSAVVQLVARFPNARLRFESLVRAEELWASSGKAARRSARPRTPSTLRAWLSGAERGALLLAASPEDERLVLERPELQLSFMAPSRLIVDLLADRRPDALPTLRTSSGLALGATVVNNTNERFAFELPQAILDDPRVSITVPLAQGDLEVVVPEPDADET